MAVHFEPVMNANNRLVAPPPTRRTAICGYLRVASYDMLGEQLDNCNPMKYGYATYLLLKDEGIPLSALPKDTTRKFPACSRHFLFFMPSAKQESSENHFLKSFGMTGLYTNPKFRFFVPRSKRLPPHHGGSGLSNREKCESSPFSASQ